MQRALDMAYRKLCDDFADSRAIWDLDAAKRWGRNPATEKQIAIIRRRCKGAELDFDNLTKLEASQILNRIMGGGRKAS